MHTRESYMKNWLKKLWREYRGFTMFVILMVIFRSALADWNTVPTGSMKPTILEGDRILVNKLAYDLRVPLTHVSIFRIDDPKRGDIVVFDSKAADTRLVKRVIGLPGDIVEMQDNRLRINGIEARYSNVEYTGDAIFAVVSYVGMTHRIQPAPTGVGYCCHGAPGPPPIPTHIAAKLDALGLARPNTSGALTITSEGRDALLEQDMRDAEDR